MAPERNPLSIAIRPYVSADAESLLPAVLESVEQVRPWLPWCHHGYDLNEARDWIARCEQNRRSGIEYNFTIVDGSGRLLGGCGLNQLRLEHRLANLGYWVRTSECGRGVATAAVRALADFAFSETELIRLELIVATGNDASRRVAEKAGALREGIAHERLYFHGRAHDAIVYALLRTHHPGASGLVP